MKQFLFCMISCIVFATAANSQTITGAWGGKIDVGNRKLLFVMKLAQNGMQYTSTFDSPGTECIRYQGGETKLTEDSLVAKIPVLSGKYSGKWNRTDTITGILQQGNYKTPLVLVRMKESEVPQKPKAPVRPQTPKARFYYNSEEFNTAMQTAPFSLEQH